MMYLTISKNPKKTKSTSIRYTSETQTYLDWLLNFYRNSLHDNVSVSDLVESLIKDKYIELANNGHVVN